MVGPCERRGGGRREEKRREKERRDRRPRYLRLLKTNPSLSLDCNSDPFGTVWESRSMITFPPLFI